MVATGHRRPAARARGGARRLPAVPVVREELGPSLPQLISPHWRSASRRRRIAAVAVVAGLLLLLVAARLILREDPLEVEVVRDPVAFNLIHRADFRRVDPRPGELLRLEGLLPGRSRVPESFVVRRLVVPPARGDISAALLSHASTRLAQLRAADPRLRYRGEGKTRINFTPGYQLTFQTRRGGRLVFGKLFLLVPEPGEGEPQGREGVELELLAPYSGQTPNPTAVGGDVLLKSPLRSFRFGTERP